MQEGERQRWGKRDGKVKRKIHRGMGDKERQLETEAESRGHCFLKIH